MPIICGFDVGQSSTSCVVADSTGTVLARGIGPGIIHLAAADGEARFVAAVTGALAAALPTPATLPAPALMVVGATGIAHAAAPEATLARRLLEQALPAPRIMVTGDAQIARVGAHGGAPGIIAIAGTGAIVLGADATGREVRVGGWGWLLDDVGSAFAIGRDGILAAIRAVDGTGPATILVSILLDSFRVTDLFDIKHLVYAPEFGAQGFAARAPLVGNAAAEGDAVARSIVTNAGQALAEQVAAVARRLDFGPRSAPVAQHGGAFGHVAGLADSFAAALPAGVRLVPGRLAPVLGAVVMGLAVSDAATSAAIERLAQTA